MKLILRHEAYTETMVFTQFNLYKNVCFYEYGHNLGRRGSPDMILIASDVKSHGKKNEISQGL